MVGQKRSIPPIGRECEGATISEVTEEGLLRQRDAKKVAENVKRGSEKFRDK